MCDQHLETAKTLCTAAGAAIAGAIVAAGVALALNGGFFSAVGAPIPMMIAAGLAASAAGLLAGALAALAAYTACGGLHPTCEGGYGNLRNAIAGAGTAAGTSVYACSAAAPLSWIPWGGSLPIGIALAGLAVTAGAIGLVAHFWAQVRECSSAAARKAGALEPGEKLSDPWWLRLRPTPGKNAYAWPVGEHLHLVPGTEKTEWRDSLGSEVRCGEYTIGEWRIEAAAEVRGTVAGSIEFSWSLDGEPLSGATLDAGGRECTLSTTVPSRISPGAGSLPGGADAGECALEVVAKDTGSGRVVVKSVWLQLPARDRQCFGRMIYPIPSLELDSPIRERFTRERLTRASDAFARVIGIHGARVRQPAVPTAARSRQVR